MRYTLYFLLSLFVISNLQAQESIKTKIESAKVFIEGAEIKRTGQLKLRKGKNEFKLTDLSTTLDPQTIQVNTPNATLLSIRHEIDFLESTPPASLKGLYKEERQLKDSMKLLNLQLEILRKKAQLLEKNANVSSLESLNGTEFKSTLEYLDKNFKENIQNQFRINEKILEIDRRLDRLNSQISASNGEKKERSVIQLTVLSDKEQTIDISTSYSIKNAGWFPNYDIRAIDTQSPLSITYKAKVYQNSGIDWENIELTLSSGSLESNSVAPRLYPTYLDKRGAYNAPQSRKISGIVRGAEDGAGLPGVTLLVKGSTIGVASGPDGRFTLQVPAGKNYVVARYLGYKTQEKPIGIRDYYEFYLQPDIYSAGEVVVTGYSSQQKRDIRATRRQEELDKAIEEETIEIELTEIEYQTNFVYQIEEPYSIPSNGQSETVNIFKREVDANIYYAIVPKIKNEAYLVADVANWEQLKLMDGESNLYISDTYVGKSLVSTDLGGDTLNLSIGKDNGLIVTRERLKEYEKNKSFSNKKQDQRTYEITVTSTKSTSSKIKVYDQLPLVSTKEFKVTPIDLAGAKLDEETGFLTWDIDLDPGEKKTIRFSFNIEYPKNRNINFN